MEEFIFLPCLANPNLVSGRSGQHVGKSRKAGRGKRRMLPAFRHRVRPRTLMTSIRIPFHVALHVADVDVFQSWLLDLNSSDIRPLLEFSHF